MAAVPYRSLPPRPRRRAARDDLRRWRARPARRPAHGLSQDPRPALLGAQDQDHAGQGPQGGPKGRQGRSARGDERPYPSPGTRRRLADRWQDVYPKAVACLRNDLDAPLTCWHYPSLEVEQQRLFHTGYEPDRIHLRHRSSAHREDQGLLVTLDGAHHGLQALPVGQQDWRRLDGSHQRAEIIKGVKFKDAEMLTERAA